MSTGDLVTEQREVEGYGTPRVKQNVSGLGKMSALGDRTD
jgi:hypothetical protein